MRSLPILLIILLLYILPSPTPATILINATTTSSTNDKETYLSEALANQDQMFAPYLINLKLQTHNNNLPQPKPTTNTTTEPSSKTSDPKNPLKQKYRQNTQKPSNGLASEQQPTEISFTSSNFSLVERKETNTKSSVKNNENSSLPSDKSTQTSSDNPTSTISPTTTTSANQQTSSTTTQFYTFDTNDDDDDLIIQSTTESELNVSSTPKNTTSSQQIISNSSNSADQNPKPPNKDAPITTAASITKSTTQSTDVHPLLIYSVRYEIKSYDLHGPHATLLSGSNQMSPQSSNYLLKTTKTQGTSTLNSNLQSSATHTNEQQQHPVKHSKTLLAGLKNTICLDFYWSEANSYIFWADVNEERIYKGSIFNGTVTNFDAIIQTGLATAEGLAVDWIGRNIYWVESTLDHIEVADMNGTSRRTLIAGDMESPRAIAVDPRVGLLFWSDWDKKSPRIERATMSGEDRKTIFNIKEVNGAWPNGLTLDYDSYKIYWIDANSDSIHMIDYEGNNHQQLLKQLKSIGHPFSMTLFQNNLFWTDWKTNSISTANKYNGSDTKELQRLATRLFDIKVFHPSRQPRIPDSLNPCLSDNGGCSHLCLLSVNHTRKCECPNLMKLSQDDKTCIMSEKILLIGRTNEIRAVDIYKPLYRVMAPINVPKVFVPKQFEFYSKSKTIFWADSSINEVKRAHLSGTNIDTIIDVIIESPSGLALDWISGNIYVTSSLHNKNPGKIYISNMEGEYISILMDNQSSGIVSPKSIAVHPTMGLLFCVDEGSGIVEDDAVIFMANMDGTNKQVISSRKINPLHKIATSLSIDYELDRVYWVNQHENASIQYYDIKNGNIYTILDETDSSERINPTMLCVDGDSLIIGTRIPSDAIIRMSVNDVSNKTILRTQNLDQLSALRIFNSSTQVGVNLCSVNNGNCSQLCIPTNTDNEYTKSSRTCKCTMGYTNNPSNQSECIGKEEFLIYSYNLGMKGIGLEPKSSPDDYYLPPIHRAFRASSIDFVHKDNLIYWVDNEEGSITRINRDTTNYKLIVQGLESEESIAIDWVAGNLYWLDPYYDIIEVARLNGSNRYVIVSGDMEKPNGIVVNPIEGYIAWSDAGSSFPRIEVAQLDGSNRKSIVTSNLSHVDDLAIDYVENYIYWVDSGLALVERIKPDGTGRRVVYNKSSYNHLASIAIYKDYLYIADAVQNHGSIIRCDKNSIHPNSCKEIIKNLGDGIRDIAIFSEQLMPPQNQNPCMTNNGGCQDLCLFMGKPGKKRCICSHGKLKSDGLTCKPIDTFVLFSKLSQIDTLYITDDASSNNSPYPPIVMESRSNIISLTVDYKNQRVIYSDMIREHIASVFFNGTDRRVLVEKQSLVEGITFANDQLYWTNINDYSISRLNITSFGKKVCYTDLDCSQPPKVEKIIELTTEDKLRGIVVDVCTSYVYWTNWNSNATIQRASPNTGYKVESIIKTNIKAPNGITIDQSLRRLYWCDARLDKIEACDMDGTNRVVLLSLLPQHPFALAIWDNYVFWTDWIASGVFKADKMTGANPIQINKVLQRPMGIAVAAHENIECPIDHCINNNGGCPPNTTCIMKYPNHKTVGIVECRSELSSLHDLKLPKFKHCKDGGDCSPSSYHDVIMMSMERYNMTDLNPIEWNNQSSTIGPEVFKSTPTSPESNTNNQDYANRYNSGGQEQPKESIENLDRKTSQNSSTPATSTKSPEKTETSDNQRNSDKPLIKPSTSSSPATPPSQPTLIDSTKETSSITINNNTTDLDFAHPTTSTSNLTAVNNSTLPPCQVITPAAQRSTTGSNPSETCKSSGEFKCYLSEKLLCIPSDRRCDGNHDCPSKEDENECYFSKRGSSLNLSRETSNWHRFVIVILVILGAAVAAVFLVFGTKGRRRWFLVSSNGAFNHTRMFDDNGTNIEISNPMFDEDDNGNLGHCAFSIDLNETTNFSNPLYERQVLLMTDKHNDSKRNK